MFDERDAEDAIRALDRIEFGRKGRRLRVEWSKEERGRKPESSRKPSSNTSRPTKTLFVINFDPYNTKTRDLERHFDPYGKILNVRIRRNFAFIQYETLEDATKALDATNMSKLLDRVITVEFAIKDDDERKSGYSPDRNHGRSPRRSHGRGRSPSPYARERESPDYGHGHGHARSRSPYRRERASPEYGRGSSPVQHGRGRNSEYGHGRSQSPGPRKDTIRSHDRSPSPRKERSRSENGYKSSPRERPSPDYERRMGRSPLVEKKNSVSPDDYDRGQRKKDRVSTDDYDRDQRKKVRVSPDDYDRDQSPSPNPEVMDSPTYGGAESPIPERDGSRTPPLQERSRS